MRRTLTLAGLGAFALPAVASADCTIPMGQPRDPADNSFDGTVQVYEPASDSVYRPAEAEVTFGPDGGEPAQLRDKVKLTRKRKRR